MTALVILAAGGSARMGSPKQLLPYRGRPLLRHAVETALATQCRPVIVVLGCRAEEFGEALSGLDVQTVTNARWEEGMGTSIQVGVQAAQGSGADSLILSLADQPLVTADLLDRLIQTHHQTGQPIVSSSYAGTVGVPVFFAKQFFAPLMALKPEQGCKGLILSNDECAVHLPCPEAELDVDTPEEFAAIATEQHAL